MYLSTNKDSSDRRIVIADTVVERRRPIVDMNMLKSSLVLELLDCGGHEDVVQLLRVLVKNVGVSFHRRDTHQLVKLSHELCERREHGTSLSVFVKITSHDYLCFRVTVQDSFHEFLPQGISWWEELDTS